jgi:molybdate transport system regulatory protein
MPALSALAQHVTRRPQRLALLAQVGALGSITAAAKAVGLSYKAAWDAIDELNNLAAQPLVERSVGGRGGGGARLSAAGTRLVNLYQRLENLQAQVLQAAEDDGDLQLLGRLLLRTSARNQLGGQVCAIHSHGHHDLIEVQLHAGARLQAQITAASTSKLELQVGSNLVALIKAGWLSLQPLAAEADSRLNQLQGRIEQILPADDGPSEIRIDLGNGQTLCALMAAAQLQSLGLSTGSAVRAQFSCSQVLLGSQL